MYLNIRTVCVLEPFHTNITLNWDWRSKSHILKKHKQSIVVKNAFFSQQYFASCVSLSVSPGTNWLLLTYSHGKKKEENPFQLQFVQIRQGAWLVVMLPPWQPHTQKPFFGSYWELKLGSEHVTGRTWRWTLRPPEHLFTWKKLKKYIAILKKGCALRGDILHKQHRGNDTDTQTHSEHINRMTALFAGGTHFFFLTRFHCDFCSCCCFLIDASAAPPLLHH